ncbi:hypothetical protein BDV93DRAFT_523440 [Ceratobasidium sp. AG-I]|nr:hypothetical protein BDV93DRAFT_523440 [Ceratobasidium sp. AG-I]
MSRLISIDPKPEPLLLVTDICYCTNILRLPYVLRHEDGGSFWEETGDCAPSEWPSNKRMLHFAATSEGQTAHEFKSTGGIFTREFGNIPPRARVTLATRSKSIQEGMDAFFVKYEKGKPGEHIVQQHQVFSSHKYDLDNKKLFHDLGFC